MKKDKEWFIKELLGHEIGDYGNYYNSGYEDGLAYALKLAHRLDEPTKVEPLVVPRGLGEWLAEQSLGAEGSFFTNIKNLEDMWAEGGFLDFITDNKKELIEVILGTRGYEVEKKLYYVLNDAQQLMLVNVGYVVPTLASFELVKQSGILKKYQLTEEEIKKYDERYWSFALEVSE